MSIVHFDCFSGISGDMTAAALVDAGASQEAIQAGVASLGLPIELKIEKIRKAGFAATSFQVHCPAEQKHRHLHHVMEILGRAALSPRQRSLAERIFQRLAEAESTVHGIPIENVHFHEVGALDSIVDIVAVAIGLDLLTAVRITSRPVPTGTGTVRCAHGTMPVPAPGTAELLKGAPLAACSIQAELTTPTGAAILATTVDEWVESPAMIIDRIGYGAGARDLAEQPNLLRILVGRPAAPSQNDQVWQLETNLDDLSAEMIGYCYDRLFEAGALDVFTASVFMKKNRPGVMLSVLVEVANATAVEDVLFRETSTLGIRKHLVSRRKLERRSHIVQTRWGPVQGKLSWQASGDATFSPEYEGCARVAREQKIALREVYAAAVRAYNESQAS